MIERHRGIITIIMYGFIWGLMELFLGGYLHLIHFPQKGYVMGGIAYTILAVYVVKHHKVFAPMVIGFIAASFKLFNILIFGAPVF